MPAIKAKACVPADLCGRDSNQNGADNWVKHVVLPTGVLCTATDVPVILVGRLKEAPTLTNTLNTTNLNMCD